jgi:DUF1680 family protein
MNAALRMSAALVAITGIWAANIPAQQISSPTDVVPPVVPLQALPFQLSQVQLLDGPFRDAMLRDKAYLLSLDPDRLLYNFRVNYGLATSNAAPYGGWEAPGVQLRGHIVGHYLSAMSLMYGSTGDAQLKTRIDYTVSELARCQAAAPANGFRTNYLSAFPESYIDLVVSNQPVWAPWYTIHKIMAGLLDAYQVAGNTQALQVVSNEADWVKARLDPLTTAQIQTMLNTEFGGMSEVLASIYAATGNTNYLQTARQFDHQAVLNPLAAQSDQLDPLHVNTQIPKIIGAAREYQMTGVSSYLTIANFFWQRVTQYRSWAFGTPGDNEYFFPTNTFPQHLSPATAETCNIYNLLKLTRYLFSMNPDPHLIDYYERGLFNHVLASQEPTQAMMTYLMSLKPGHFKTYSTPQNSFWCCVGTGLENHSKYGDTIYFHDAGSLYVNLFVASQLTWPQMGLVLQQDTTFPQTNTTLLTFTCTNPVNFTLKIRYPVWAQSGMSVTVNGSTTTYTGTPSTYISLNRTWQSGDQVRVQIPMSLRTEALPDGTDPNTVALFYGPVLLAGALGQYQMPASDFAVGQGDLLSVADPLVPVMVCDTNGLVTNTLPVAGLPLTFLPTNIAQPYNVTLIPFYETHHQRYTVYWKLMTATAWQQWVSNQVATDARQVDYVSIGDSSSESAHGLQSLNSYSGSFNGRNWRDARSGGWFSYVLQTLRNQPMTLDVTYWGSDSGNRVFDILINGQLIATQTLTNNNPGVFFDVFYPIPVNLTTNQTSVTVRFQAHAGATAGGIFGLRMMTVLDPGPLQSITLTASPTQGDHGLGSHQFARVVANYQNLTNHSIVSSPNLVLLSSDTTVLTTGANGEIDSVAPGTATITANYLGYTSSMAITVTSTPLSYLNATLRHRYRFASTNVVNGTNVVDLLNPSSSALSGILRGNATINGQQLTLDGSAGTYVDLPPSLVSNYNGVTVEAWASFGTEPTWAYLFAFGDTASGLGQNGFWFTPHSGSGDYRLILSDITGQANEYRITAPGFLDGLSGQQLVAVLDLNNSYEALYLNGALVGERSDVPFDQTAIHDLHSYIGRSAYSADPTMVGAVNEVRIYEGRMTAPQAAASYSLGPNMVLADLKLGFQLGFGTFTVSWPTNAVAFALQASSQAGPAAVWMPVPGSPTVVGTSFQLTLPLTNAAQFFRLKY